MHRTAKLTVFGRRLLVERIEIEGWPVAHAAAMTGVSRQTATNRVRRYRAEGPDGLEDRSSRPRRSPRSLAPEQVAAILAASGSIVALGAAIVAGGTLSEPLGWACLVAGLAIGGS
jgi:hypothetical protein